MNEKGRAIIKHKEKYFKKQNPKYKQMSCLIANISPSLITKSIYLHLSAAEE